MGVNARLVIGCIACRAKGPLGHVWQISLLLTRFEDTPK